MLQYPIHLLYSLAFLFYHFTSFLFIRMCNSFLQNKNKRQFQFYRNIKVHRGKNSIVIQNNITLNYVIKISHKLDA